MKSRGEYKDSRNYFLGHTVFWWVLSIVLSRIFLEGILALIIYGLLTLLVVVFAILSMYNWAKMKGQSKWYALWGILFPIGCLPMALLKDRNKERNNEKMKCIA